MGSLGFGITGALCSLFTGVDGSPTFGPATNVGVIVGCDVIGGGGGGMSDSMFLYDPFEGDAWG